MQDSTRKILAEADKRNGNKRRTLYFMGGAFKINYNVINYTLEKISLSNIDMDCEQEDIYTGPFNIIFNKQINLEKGNIKECEWNEDDKILKANGEEFKYLDTDLQFFTDDLHADLNNAIDNLMKYFADWIKKP